MTVMPSAGSVGPSFALSAGIIISAIMFALLILGFFWTPFDPEKMSGGEKFLAPSLTHLMGCDNFGRDILSRVLKGGGTTLIIAAVTVFFGALFGTCLGAVSAYAGGLLDEILMRIIDAIAAFPSILLALVLIGLFGSGKYKIMLALVIAFIPSFTRVMRGEFLNYRDREFVKSARLMGAGPLRIIVRHIFPLTLPVLLSAMTVGFNNAVLAEASMSYLGLGVTPPDPSLGRMLSEGQAYLASAPWCVLGPGLFMIILILGVGLLGDGITERGSGTREKKATIIGRARGLKRKVDRKAARL